MLDQRWHVENRANFDLPTLVPDISFSLAFEDKDHLFLSFVRVERNLAVGRHYANLLLSFAKESDSTIPSSTPISTVLKSC